MTTPPFGSTPCTSCGGTGLSKYTEGKCPKCHGEAWIIPEGREDEVRKAEHDVDPPGDDSMNGEGRKREGQGRVLYHTEEGYKAAFKEHVRGLPEGERFIAEDVTDVVGMPPGHHSAIGALMTACGKAGLIRHTGGLAKARRASRNAGESRVWERI